MWLTGRYFRAKRWDSGLAQRDNDLQSISTPPSPTMTTYLAPSTTATTALCAIIQSFFLLPLLLTTTTTVVVVHGHGFLSSPRSRQFRALERGCKRRRAIFNQDVSEEKCSRTYYSSGVWRVLDGPVPAGTRREDLHTGRSNSTKTRGGHHSRRQWPGQLVLFKTCWDNWSNTVTVTHCFRLICPKLSQQC